MTGTAQMAKTAVSSSTWASIFPPEMKTKEQSLFFVKRLVAVGISSITYLRTLFPEVSYRSCNLDGLQLKMLMENTACHKSNMVVSWIKGCFEAIEKQYLRQLTFVIYVDPDKPDVPLETYTYKFCYSDEEGPVISEMETNFSVIKKEKKLDVKRSTEKMLRSILLLTQTLQPLPRKIHLAMKLGYYDNVTPEDYEPPGFKEGGHGSFVFDNNSCDFKVGDVSTCFHTVKLRVSVDKKSYSTDENSANNSKEEKDKELPENPGVKNFVQSSETNEVLVRSYAKVSLPRTCSYESSSSGRSCHAKQNGNCDSPFVIHHKNEPAAAHVKYENQLDDITMNVDNWVPSITEDITFTSGICNNISSQDDAQLVPQMPTQNSNVRTLSLPSPLQTTPASLVSVLSVRESNNREQTGFVVRCPCNVNQDDGLMILCDICNNWQHAVCFNVLEESEAPQRHVCVACSTAALPSTDPTLRDHPEMEMCCLYRRTLMFLQGSSDRITASLLGQRLGVNISIAKKLLTRLQKDKLLTCRGRVGSFSNQTKIRKIAFPEYLNRESHEGTAEAGSGVNDTAQTPNSMQSNADFDDDATPDLHISSLLKSLTCSRTAESVELITSSLDETLDILNDTQDVTVGTQIMPMVIDNGLEVIDSEKSDHIQETVSETMATAGDTMATFESQLASKENTTASVSAPAKDLHNSSTYGEDMVFTSDTSKSHERKSVKQKRKLIDGESKLSRGKRTVCSESLDLHHFEICDSQGSDGPPDKRRKTSTTIKTVKNC